MKKFEKPQITDIIIILLCAVFFIGMLTFLSACGAKEDGSFMTCHYANQMLTGISGAMTVLAILRLFTESKVKIGLDLSKAVLSVLSIFVPGHLIGLCMMPDMRCRAVMKPGATVFLVLILIAAVCDLIMRIRNKDNA